MKVEMRAALAGGGSVPLNCKQNLPKERGLREQYIPADGSVLVSIDFVAEAN